jgi:transposase
MKPYSVDFREKVVSAIEKGDSSFRKVAERFAISKNCVERWVIQKRTQGHVVPRKQGGSVSAVMQYKAQLMSIHEKQSDATLAEYCELLADATGLWVSQSTMCRTFQRLNLPRKKTLRSSQATSERVQLLRAEYWAQVTTIDLKDLVFLDEMGILLGLMRTHARAAPGERAYDFKPFYRGSKVSVIGAITVSKVLAVMTINDSMDAAAFKVYVSKCLVPQLWKGAVVVMDNLPAHKVEAIAPLIEAVGARTLYMSPYSPEFNPIEHWWSQLKAFLRQFSPTTSKRVDTLIATALDLINPKHLRNWFAHCCYCPL